MSSVLAVQRAQDHLLVTLDQSPFRAAGGGQPADQGSIANGAFSGEVVDVLKEDGGVQLKVKATKGNDLGRFNCRYPR